MTSILPTSRVSRLFPDGGRRKSPWQPGIIAVKFRENVRPLVNVRTADDIPVVQSLGCVDLAEFHILARKWHVRHIQHTADLSYEEADRAQELARKSGKQSHHLKHFVWLHTPSNAAIEQISGEFAKLPCIEFASPVPSMSGSATTNDRFLGASESIVPIGLLENQWYIFHCKADQAWDIATGNGVTINIVDEGFDPHHEDLQSKVDAVFNSTTNSDAISTPATGTKEQLNHGTGAAGLAAAAANNNIGIAGFAFDARLRLVQAFKDPRSTDQNVPKFAVTRAINWAADQAAAASGRNVTSISLGVGPGRYEQVPVDAASNVHVAIDQAIVRGTVVCISAGNTSSALGRDVSTDLHDQPFVGSNAIVVGAMRRDATGIDVPANTNWGWRMTVCAPGDAFHDMTCSTGSDKYTNRYGGASGATPKVAGTAALMLQANSNLTHDQIKAILNGTGTPLPGNNHERPFGPLLNTFEAVKAAQVPASGPKLIANRFLAFGNVKRNTPSPAQSVTLFNIGVDPLNLISLTQTSGSVDFKITAQPTVPGPINPGDKPAIAITFTPTSHDDVDATFSLVSNDPASPLLIHCTGTAPWTLGDYLAPFRWIGRHPVAATVGVGAIVVLILILTGKIKL